MTEVTMSKRRPSTGPTVLKLGENSIPLLDRARIYTCGITPYDVTHLGHAATFVWVDTLSRILRAIGVEPLVCRNVTDIDDVLTDAARKAGIRYDHFAAFGQFQFEGDMSALNVRVPDYEPRARRYVDAVIRLASALIASDAAYVRNGSVYFRGRDTAERSDLGETEALQLAHEYGGRPDDKAKDDPFDVAIWQSAEPEHPTWDSPWGPGRPGWHAECVAMSMSTFGVGVDIHAGGADLRFPHHAYHAAIAESLTGVRPYARSWLHIGTVMVDGQKMAKSAENLVLIPDLLERYSAPVIRLAIIDRPWATDWEYAPGILTVAAARLENLHQASGMNGSGTGEMDVEHLRRLLSHNLDIPAALDFAIEQGGRPARLLTAALGLT